MLLPMSDSTLHKQAVVYLQARKREELEQIATDTGLGFWWLDSLRKDRFKDPGVGKIEALLRHAGLLGAAGVQKRSAASTESGGAAA